MALLFAFALLVMGVAGQGESAIIREPAIIVSRPSAPLLSEGSRLSISCAAYGYPLPTITWSSDALGVTDFAAVEGNDNTIRVYNTTYQDNTGNVFVISILELCDGDPMYLTDIACSADNGLNPVSDIAVVNTIPTGIYAPVVVASQNSSTFLLTESRLSLTCAAWGSPAPRITWDSEGGGVSGAFNVYTKEIKQTGGEIFVVSVLELCNSSLVDYYKEYSCTANSKLDQQADESTFTLNPFADIESIGFEYKPSTGLLKMLFSGPVDIEYINCDQRQFTYQDASVTPGKVYTPIHPGDCFQSSEKEITFSLDIEDYARMLNVNGLFQSVGNVTFAWNNTLGTVYNIAPGQLVMSRLELNAVRPSLQSFDMDMREGVITLFFDSVVNFDTLAPQHLTLQAGRNTSYPHVNITQGQALSSTRYGTTLCLALYADQLQYLSNGSNLCNGIKTCYLSLTSSLIEDPYGNPIVPVAPTEPIQASKYRPSRIPDEGLLRVELMYLGCVRNIQLYPNEVFIIRPDLRESVRSVGCDVGSNTQLTWKQGGQNRSMSPFGNSPISSFDFPHGLSPENYGVFVCTWNNRDSQNYIVDENPFVGSPDGPVVMQTLYNPISLDVHYGAVNQVYDSAFVYRVGGVTDSSVEASLEDFYLNITVGYAGVLYSLFGHYVANITTAMGYPDLVFEFLIEVQDPTVNISTTTVEIEEEQQSLSLSCNPSSPYLPIAWREGNNKLTSDDAGIVLNPPNLSHQLNIDLNTHSLTGQDIFCEVMDPEGLRGAVAMASTTVLLLSGLYCESDRDSEWNVLWNRTLAGVTAQQGCPQQGQDQTISGFAKRKCLENGVWEDFVDVSGCANVEISNLAEQVEIALSTSDIAARDLLLSDLLQNLAEELAPSDTLFLFAQDLSTSNVIVENVVSKLTEDIEGRVSSRLQADVINVFNNMLDESNIDIWMQVENTTDGSQLLYNAEGYASYVAQALTNDFIDTTSYGDSISFRRQNIDVAAQVLDATYEDILYPADEEETSENAQIRIPAQYLSSRNATAVVNILFSNLEMILPNEDIESIQPASMVLSSQVIGSRRTENMKVQLHFKTFSKNGARNPRCVYWDFNARQWVTQGIETKEILDLGSYSYQVTCESTHLTAFAVVVDTAQEEEVYELPLIGYIGVGVLVGCALISFVAFLICIPLSCFDKKSKTTCLFYFIYFGFFLTIMCAGVVFLAGLSEATEERVACAAVAALLQYLFATALCWILVATFLSIMMVAVKDNTSLSTKWCALFLVFAFGLPVLPTTISVGLLHNDYGNENFCWIRIEKNEITSDILWANAAPMIAIAVAILLTAMFGAVFNSLKYLRTVQKTVKHKNCFCSALYIQANSVLLALFVSGTWTFGLLMVNNIWDPSKWLFLGFTAALGVIGLFGSIICLCGSKVCNYDEETEDESEKYWSDTRPILKEAGQAQTAYAMKLTGKSDSAYALMSVASDTSVENMMEEPAKKAENEATSST